MPSPRNRRRNAIERVNEKNATIAPAARLIQSERWPAARMSSACVNTPPTCVSKIDRHQLRPAGPWNGKVTPP